MKAGGDRLAGTGREVGLVLHWQLVALIVQHYTARAAALQGTGTALVQGTRTAVERTGTALEGLGDWQVNHLA